MKKGKKNKHPHILADAGSESLEEIAKSLAKKATGLSAILLPFVLDNITSMNIDLRDFGKTGKKARQLVRKNPATALALAAGIGFLLAQSEHIKELVGGLTKKATDKLPELKQSQAA
jgi:hypothetical protein